MWERLIAVLTKWLEVAAAYFVGKANARAESHAEAVKSALDAALLKADLARLSEPELDDRLRKQRQRLPGAVDVSK
jgi:hypothetical protein